MERQKASAPGPSLRARALRWLSQREHSRHELRDKLLRAGGEEADASVVEALLDQLAAQGHLSDDRFVESRVHARRARFGNRRIELELRRHGVTPSADLQAQLRASELTRAREVWRKKFGSRAATNVAERARQARFLIGRGFSTDVVRKVVADSPEDDSA
ncbi:MAG TPA: recombination regulator RecX [Burkholderiaceae bacterium]|nr:recombination regulator RecX [Burkholderiaceae bacterium]